ncbi:MAG: metallophosphoesterase, partial [Bacteroidia bacterium]
MSRILSFCIFLVVFFAIDFYVFQGYKLLVRRWIPSYSTLLHIVYWAVPVILLLLIIGTMVWSPQPTKSKVMLWSSSILFGIFIAKFVWLLFMVLDDLVRIIRLGGQRVSSEPGVKPISRSQFIVTTGALLAGTLFGTMIYGIARGAHNYTVMRRKLKLKNLPKAFQGFKIVQISDVHSGSFWSKDGVKRGIQMILDQKPDAIFFTGDLVNSKT